jgi:hypothetical protein
MQRRDFLLSLAALAAVPATGTRIASAAAALKQFAPAGTAGFDHAPFDAILQAVVTLGADGYAAVDYGAVVARRADLEAYVASLEAADPVSMSKAEAHAYWINLYNAKTLALMAERWPVKSIRDIKLGGGGLFGRGPWSKKIMTVGGTELSLDDVEHRIVRALFNDPLSHYALNCASYSCPNLMPRAYTSGNLRAQMDESARLYINHPRGLAVDGGRITASKIYDWYADDFGGTRRLKAHWMDYAAPGLAEALKGAEISAYDYDWSPNVAR